MSWFSNNIRTIVYNSKNDVLIDASCREVVVRDMNVEYAHRVVLRAAEDNNEDIAFEKKHQKPLPLDLLAQRFLFFTSKPRYSFKKQTVGWCEDDEIVCHELELDILPHQRNTLQLSTLIGLARIPFALLPDVERDDTTSLKAMAPLLKLNNSSLRPYLWKRALENEQEADKDWCRRWYEESNILNPFQLPLAEWVVREHIDSDSAFGDQCNSVQHEEWYIGSYAKFQAWQKKAWPKWRRLKCKDQNCNDNQEDDDGEW